MQSEPRFKIQNIKKALTGLIIIVILACLLLGGLFGLFYYDRVYGTSCASMSELEAVQMIERILDDKASKVTDSIVLFGFNRESLEASSVIKSIGTEVTDTEFKIQYIDSVSNNRRFTAYILASCEIQWIKSTNASQEK